MDKPRGRRRSRKQTGSGRKRSLWEGIYTFPLEFENLAQLLGATLSLTILCLLLCGFYLLITTTLAPKEEGEELKSLMGVNPVVLEGAFRVFLALLVLSFFASLYPAAVFLRVVQETAWGNRKIRWSREDWFDWITDFLYVVWVALSAAALGGLILLAVDLFVPLPRVLWWGLTAAVGGFVLPLMFFSTMAGGSMWVIIYPPVLLQLLKRPWLLGLLYVNLVAFALPCLALGYWAIVDLRAWLAPAVGLVWSIFWLCYARLVGRIGWALVHEDHPAPRKKPKITRRDDDEDDDE